MAKRRKLRGTPMLVAGAGTAILMACGGSNEPDPEPVVGNLVAPPVEQLDPPPEPDPGPIGNLLPPPPPDEQGPTVPDEEASGDGDDGAQLDGE